jgi:hypothetical protein
MLTGGNDGMAKFLCPFAIIFIGGNGICQDEIGHTGMTVVILIHNRPFLS